MTERTIYPLSIRDVAPTPDAERITGVRPDGIPDGCHTGGAWRVGNEVWKPLDGLSGMAAHAHVSTREDEVLELMAGQELFPRNWRVETANGRRFLVRKFAYIVTDFTVLDMDQILQVERGVRALNRAGWEINDTISLAFDYDTYELFIVDMSNAQPMSGPGAWSADDDSRVREFFGWCGADALRKLRNNARHVITPIEFFPKKREGYRYVYASFSRPMDANWVKGAVLIHTDQANWQEMIPHTWVVTKGPLDPAIIFRHELTYGWSPIK